MTALQLYKFLTDKGLDWNRIYDKDEDRDDIILFVGNNDLMEWKQLLGNRIMSRGYLKCVMTWEYFCFHMWDICEYFGIDMDDIFTKAEIK